MALDLGELNAIIDADDKGFRRTIDRVDKSLGRLGGRMTSLTGMLGVIGKTTAFATIATGAAGAVASIGPLIVAAGTLASALAGVAAATPAFLAGGAAAAGTLALGFAGFGDALAGDEEALASLAPAAREVVSAMRDLGPAWAEVRSSVQSAMFAGIADQVETLASNLLPRLETGLTDVAGAFNGLFREAMAAADSEEAMRGLDAVLANTADAVDAFAGGMEEWVTGLGMLLESTSPLLVDAGEAAARLGGRFRDWILEAQETGRINELIDGMKDTLSTLGSLLGNVGSILASVFGAANEAGGGLLDTLEQVTGRFADWLKTAEGTEAVNAFFSSLAAVAAAATPVVLAIADAFATDLAPQIAEIATNIGPSLETVIGRLGDAVGSLDIASLADTFGRFLETLSLLLVPAAEILNLLIPFAPVILAVTAGIVAVVAAMRIWAVVVGIVTVAQWAWNAALFASPITWIILAIVALIAIVVLLVMHWDEVTAAIGAAWDWLREKAGAIWDWIGEKVSAVWDAITGAIGAAVDWVSDKVGGAWDWMLQKNRDIMNGILDFISGAWDSITGAVSGAVDKIGGFLSGMWDGIKEGLKTALNFAIGLINSAIGGINTLIDGANKVPGVSIPSIPNIPALAEGGDILSSGAAIVGEAGPELLELPRGARVSPLDSGGSAMPDEFVATIPIDLGERITEVFDVKLRRRDTDTRRRALMGTGAAR